MAILVYAEHDNASLKKATLLIQINIMLFHVLAMSFHNTFWCCLQTHISAFGFLFLF